MTITQTFTIKTVDGSTHTLPGIYKSELVGEGVFMLHETEEVAHGFTLRHVVKWTAVVDR